MSSAAPTQVAGRRAEEESGPSRRPSEGDTSSGGLKPVSPCVRTAPRPSGGSTGWVIRPRRKDGQGPPVEGTAAPALGVAAEDARRPPVDAAPEVGLHPSSVS